MVIHGSLTDETTPSPGHPGSGVASYEFRTALGLQRNAAGRNAIGRFSCNAMRSLQNSPAQCNALNALWRATYEHRLRSLTGSRNPKTVHYRMAVVRQPSRSGLSRRWCYSSWRADWGCGCVCKTRRAHQCNPSTDHGVTTYGKRAARGLLITPTKLSSATAGGDKVPHAGGRAGLRAVQP
jgi:hypothetical protein